MDSIQQTVPKMSSSISQLVSKAYTTYGSSLGVKSFKVQEIPNSNNFILMSDFYFFLKDEPYPSTVWKENDEMKQANKVHHCAVWKNGFYDYTDGKLYPTLEEWFEQAKKGIYGDKNVSIEDVLLFGRRKPGLPAFELTVSDLKKKLN
jgi:hypothetical protein